MSSVLQMSFSPRVFTSSPFLSSLDMSMAKTAGCCSKKRLSMSWELFHRVDTSWISLWEGNASCCCFYCRISAPLLLRCKKPTTFLTLPSNLTAVSAWKAFWEARFKVWAKHPRCRVISASTLAAIIFRALSVTRAGSLCAMFHSIHASFNKAPMFFLCVTRWISWFVKHDSSAPSRERYGALWLSRRSQWHMMSRHRW